MASGSSRLLGLAGLFSSAALVGGAAAAPSSAGGAAAANAAVTTDAPATRPVDFEIHLPLRNQADLDTLIKQQSDPNSSNFHKWLTPAQFAQRFGPTPATVAAARAALSAAHLNVAATHASSLTVTGDVAAVNHAFATSLKSVTEPNGVSRLVAATPLSLPAGLKAQGAVITAFANKPLLQTHARRISLSTPNNRASASGPYWFTDLRQAYEYPALNVKLPNGAYLDGTGVNVAIVMWSDAADSDVAAAFNHEKYTALTGRPAPKIIHVPVNGGCDTAAVCNDGSLEATLDTQQVLGSAPGARVSLLNIPEPTNGSVIDAYTLIVNSNAYDVVSSSFGQCELFSTPDYNDGNDDTATLKETYEAVLKQGTAQGITWVASSGDSGGLSCPTSSYVTGSGPVRYIPGVQWPASSPSVVAVGGGNLATTAARGSGTLNSAYVSENGYGDPEVHGNFVGTGGYWGATGGPSALFTAPAYQSLVNTGSSARTVPDLGMIVGGCPSDATYCGPQRSAVYLYYGGDIGGVIGTSAAAPEFAGALALYVQRNGRQGAFNTFLYQKGAAQGSNTALGFYHQRIPGFDGKWPSTYPGGAYDYIYGNGSPRIRNLFGFTDLPAAGTPQTASNP